QFEGVARGGRPPDATEDLPARVAVDEGRAGLSADERVVGRFDAAEAGVVDAHVAEHVRRQVRVRVPAPALRKEADAVEVEGSHARRLFGSGLAPHEREVTSTAGEARLDRPAFLWRAVPKGLAE